MFRTVARVPHCKSDNKDQKFMYEEPYLMDKVVKTGKDDTSFYVETTFFYKSAKDLRKELRSFDSDVGVENTLRKVKAGGENVADVVKSGRFAAKQAVNINAVNMPRTPGEVEAATKAIDRDVSRIWNSLPSELKGHMSVEDFVKKYDKSWLDKITPKQPVSVATPKKEGE